jgi:hypothetical protein
MVKDFLNGFLSLVQGREQWGFQERRKGLIRLRCSYKCLFSVGGDRIPGTITDLGEGGLALSTARSLAVGQKLKVYCPFIDLEGPCSAVDGVVCWCRAAGGLHNAGLSTAVTSESWVFSILQLLGFPGQGGQSKRRWVRAECALPARIGEQAVQVHNLGVGGALIESPHPVLDGQARIIIGPYLKLDPLQVDGIVTHLRNEALHGFEFRDLSQAQLKLLGLYLKALLRRSL